MPNALMDLPERMLAVEASNPLSEALTECSRTGRFLCLVLPNGSRVWVHTEDGLRELVAVIGDPTFVSALERAVSDVSQRRGTTLAADERPAPSAASDALCDPELTGLIEQAVDDVVHARGHVFDRRSAS